MTFSLVVHDTVSLHRNKRRSPLTCSRSADTVPVPPSLINSPYLSSPNSIFLRKSSVPKWPSQVEDEWLRDMVPIDRSVALDADTKSESSSSAPSPAASEGPNPFGFVLAPPSPMLRPRSAGPADPTPAKRAPSGPSSAHSPHT